MEKKPIEEMTFKERRELFKKLVDNSKADEVVEMLQYSVTSFELDVLKEKLEKI